MIRFINVLCALSTIIGTGIISLGMMLDKLNGGFIGVAIVITIGSISTYLHLESALKR